MSKYSSTTHTTYNVGYHVVFSPKYRHSLLRYRTADILKKLIQETASNLGISIPVMEVMPDHVHLFVTAKPSLPIDDIVMRIKGYSSYFLRHHSAYLRKYPSLWTRSYFMETVGHISKKTVVQYITNQKSKALSSPS
ncbi:MAG: IS200/IS605 family transposase [Bacteroidales bacterium]|nr:IS200/IS605 family transposase [Bacteroidales bacterium]